MLCSFGRVEYIVRLTDLCWKDFCDQNPENVILLKGEVFIAFQGTEMPKAEAFIMFEGTKIPRPEAIIIFDGTVGHGGIAKYGIY